MMELLNVNQENFNSKNQVIIDMLKDGQEFLEEFNIDYELINDTIVLLYKFLKNKKKIPHNLYKFFIAAFYIISRHPQAFPAHESKKKFCKKFGIQPTALEYSVEVIIGQLNIIKILDDKNFPYFLDLKSDIGFKLAKSIIKQEVEKAMMDFLTKNQTINSQFLCEDLITRFVFEMNLFPEELLRQFYDLILDLIENYLQDYYEYVDLQQNIFI